MSATPNTRIIVKLPFPRPDVPLEDPTKIVWTADKANILWEVIARARASDSGGADWKGLAAHLEVPLPYLLYRAQLRYEEDLKGLQDIRGALSPISPQAASKHEEFPSSERPILSRQISGTNAPGSPGRPPSSSSRSTPMGVRARLASLTNKSVRRQASSSTVTLQGPRKAVPRLPPTSPSTSGSDSEEEQEFKEAEAERKLEEQEILDRKLRDLQQKMTDIGLVSSPRPKNTTSKGKSKDESQNRGRLPSGSNPRPTNRHRLDDELSSRSQSMSSTTSPQGSTPSIPSPPLDSLDTSPTGRNFPSIKPSSQPALFQRVALGQTHVRSGPLSGRLARGMSDEGSAQGSSASSFSDISDASLSASALESALLSNVRGQGSRFSAASVFARNRFGGRGGSQQ